MYSEIEYWNRRPNPNVEGRDSHDIEYVIPHIESCDTVLDFGPGIGRTFGMYKDKSVVGHDISLRYRRDCFLMAKRFGVKYKHEVGSQPDILSHRDKEFDAAVCMNVLLHQRPEIIKNVMSELARVADKVVVTTWYDRECVNTAPHCFIHEYEDLLDGYEIFDIRTVPGNQLYFVYSR